MNTSNGEGRFVPDRAEGKALFLSSCEREFSILKEEGVFPDGFVRTRLAAARALQDGFPNPEVEGVRFAQSGADDRRRLLRDAARVEAYVRPGAVALSERIAALKRRKIVGMIDDRRMSMLSEVQEYAERPHTALSTALDRWKTDQLALIGEVESPWLDRLIRSYRTTYGEGDMIPSESWVSEDVSPENSAAVSDMEQCVTLIGETRRHALARAERYLDLMENILSPSDSNVVPFPDHVKQLRIKYNELREKVETFRDTTKEVLSRIRIADRVTNDPLWDRLLGSYEKAISEHGTPASGDRSAPESIG